MAMFHSETDMKVTVDRLRLIATLKQNLAEHRDEFERAIVAYRQRVIEELDEMLADARKGGELRLVVRLTAPQDHTRDYQRVLDMLEMHTGSELTLDTNTFARLVLNEWDWYERAKTVNSTYASGGKLAL